MGALPLATRPAALAAAGAPDGRDRRRASTPGPLPGAAPRPRGAVAARVCFAPLVLSSMRDASGGPNRRMKLLALVVALLLAGPLTLALLRGAAAAVRLAV